MIAPAPASYLKNWTPEQFAVLEKAVLLAEHRLHETGLFTDEALAALIDKHPEEYLTISTMGSDDNKFEWIEGERNGVAADVLLNTVKEGKLWINLIRLMDFDEDYRKLVNSVYDELERNVTGFKAQHRTANLLISSPNAIVYYHVDIPVNMLWHLRGRKRVWVYPYDDRFVSQINMERLVAGEMSEDMPYEPWFKDFALSFDVEPGQILTWPQNTPHHVTNLEGLNVSLSTEHRNPVAKRRVNVHHANRLLRRKFGFQKLSDSPYGVSAHVKEAITRGYFAMDKVFGKGGKVEHFAYKKRFLVDPSAPEGYTMVDGESKSPVEEAPDALASV